MSEDLHGLEQTLGWPGSKCNLSSLVHAAAVGGLILIVNMAGFRNTMETLLCVSMRVFPERSPRKHTAGYTYEGVPERSPWKHTAGVSMRVFQKGFKSRDNLL